MRVDCGPYRERERAVTEKPSAAYRRAEDSAAFPPRLTEIKRRITPDKLRRKLTDVGPGADKSRFDSVKTTAEEYQAFTASKTATTQPNDPFQQSRTQLPPQIRSRTSKTPPHPTPEQRPIKTYTPTCRAAQQSLSVPERRPPKESTKNLRTGL